jgi:hypothetical protein
VRQRAEGRLPFCFGFWRQHSAMELATMIDSTLSQKRRSFPLAEEKLYKAEYVGSGTFIISKPKRKERKLRQSRVKNRRRGMRK